jgi:isoleucyl-tRNA synthetase
VQAAIRASKTGDWTVTEDGTVVCGGLPLLEGEYTLETVVAGDAAGREAVAVLPSGGFVALDLRVTPELAREGLARDLMRAVQQVRRDQGLAVGDRILLTVSTDDPGLREAVEQHRAMIGRETLATQLRTEPGAPTLDGAEVTVGDDRRAVLSVRKAD